MRRNYGSEPCRSRSGTPAWQKKSAGAKSPDLCWPLTARLKSCPDTKHQSGDSRKLAHSVDQDLSSLSETSNFICNKRSIIGRFFSGFFVVRPGRAHGVIASRLGDRVAHLSKPCGRGAILHPAAKPEQGFLLVARIFCRQPGQRVGHYV